MTGAKKFIIKGQTLNTNSNIRDPSNNTFSTFSDTNIYQQCCMAGVYMINGSEGAISNMFPIFCSAYTLTDIGIFLNNDDAYLVYPGFGFKLFTGVGYDNTTSCIYYNAGTKPYVYVLDNTNWPGATKRVYQFGYDNINGYQYPKKSTRAIKIYFRGNEITGAGLS